MLIQNHDCRDQASSGKAGRWWAVVKVLEDLPRLRFQPNVITLNAASCLNTTIRQHSIVTPICLCGPDLAINVFKNGRPCLHWEIATDGNWHCSSWGACVVSSVLRPEPLQCPKFQLKDLSPFQVQSYSICITACTRAAAPTKGRELFDDTRL